MREPFLTLKTMLERGEDAVLVTVTGSSGSVPRSAGARMLVGKSGYIGGTVGGGAVERRSIDVALQVLQDRRSRQEHFCLRPNEVEDLGMICGGDMELSFDYFPAGDEAALALCGSLDAQSKQAGLVYVFGGGHVAQALVPVLAGVEFRCVVLEDRAEFCRPELFPGAEDCRLIDFDRIPDSVCMGAEDYAVILTRGHKCDQAAVAAALKTPARYIGVIGSRRKSAQVFANLRDLGFTDGDLRRVTTPIGLPILAETPAEIAVSIAAQLIETRAEPR